MHNWTEFAARRSKVDGHLKNLLQVLADYANKDGVCWPGVGTLARNLKRTPRAVQLALRGLAEAGALVEISGGGRGRAGRGVSNVYVLIGDELTGGHDRAECERLGRAKMAELRGADKGATDCAVETRNKSAIHDTPRAQSAAFQGRNGLRPKQQWKPHIETSAPATPPALPMSTRYRRSTKPPAASLGSVVRRFTPLGGAAEGIKQTNNSGDAARIKRLLFDRGCDQSFCDFAGSCVPLLIVQTASEAFDRDPGSIRNPGGWFRGHFRQAGVQGL